MKHKTWVRVVSLFLLLALIVGVVPSAFAVGSDAASASVVEAARIGADSGNGHFAPKSPRQYRQK